MIQLFSRQLSKRLHNAIAFFFLNSLAYVIIILESLLIQHAIQKDKHFGVCLFI